MRILISGSTGESMPPPFAGIPKVSLLYARAFKRLGHDVGITWVYRPKNADDIGANAEYFFEYSKKPGKLLKLVFFVRYFLRDPFLYISLFRAYWARYPKFTVELVLYAAYGVWVDRVIASFHPDVIACQATLIKTFMVAYVASRRTVPLVFEPYAEIHAQDMGVNKQLNAKAQENYWRPFLRMADLVIGMDNCSVGAQSYLPPSKVKVFYDACDYGAYQVPVGESTGALRDELGLPRDVVLVGTVGAFEQRKGHDYLIRALGVLRREHIPVGAVICGGPGDYRKWQILAKKEGVEDRVFFFRNFSESQLTRLHHALDIYANLSNMSRSCGLDLALLEAMSAGLPVVVFDHGALPHAVPSGENGIVVPTRDTGALSSAIRRLAAMSREERMRMGEKSAAFAKQYDIHAMAKTKLEWFEEVIANRDSS